MAKTPGERFVKTSLKLREDLWKRARILAIEENSELQVIVNQALEQYLKGKGGAR